MNFIDVNEIVEMNAVHTAMRASPDKLRSANFSTTEKRILEETIVKFPVIEDKKKQWAILYIVELQSEGLLVKSSITVAY